MRVLVGVKCLLRGRGIHWNSLLCKYSSNGLPERVIECYGCFIKSGHSPDEYTFAITLSASAKLQYLHFGRALHSCLFKTGLQSHSFCQAALINLYAKCNSLNCARTIFDSSPSLDTFSFTSLISAYVQAGFPHQALHIFDKMLSTTCLIPDQLALVTVLNAYISVGYLDHACLLFQHFPIISLNVVAWNIMISAHAKLSLFKESLSFFLQMRKHGVQSSRSTLASVLSAIASLASLHHGLLVHAHSIKQGFESSVYVASSLINMYGKCEILDAARRLFDDLSHKNIIVWNTMLGVYSQNGYFGNVMDLFLDMTSTGVHPDEFTYTSILSSCSCYDYLQIGRQLHSTIIKKIFSSNLCVNNALIDMYAKAGSLKEASKQFEHMTHRDHISWNALIVGYVQEEEEAGALGLFQRMNLHGVIPDEVSLASILSACGNVKTLVAGQQCHGLSLKLGLETNLFTGSSLIDMYSKCGVIEDAHKIYYSMPERSVVSVNALIAGYALKNTEEAINLLHEMQILGLKPSEITFASLIDVCKGPPMVMLGLQIHCSLVKRGLLCGSEFLGTSLLGMYLDSQRLADANILFSEFSNLKSTIMWTALISGHTQNECSDVALKLYREMRDNNILPDQAAFVTVLRACALLPSLHDGTEIHSLIFHTGFDLDEFTSSALVDMYAKCGDVKSAVQVFEELVIKKDVISWNSMIVGFAKNGYAESALKVFDEMTQSCTTPDDVTFLGLLTACSHAGWVDEGRQIFDIMVNYYGIEPRLDHYACMVDLLGRWGFLQEAEEFIDKLDVEPNAMIWANLLGACRIHGDEKRGQRAAKKLIKLEPQNSSAYVLLSNMYAASGHWNEARSLRRAMTQKDIQKMPGCSWIVVGQKTNLFVAGDISHHSYNEISQALKHLTSLIKDNRFQDDGISWVGQK